MDAVILHSRVLWLIPLLPAARRCCSTCSSGTRTGAALVTVVGARRSLGCRFVVAARAVRAARSVLPQGARLAQDVFTWIDAGPLHVDVAFRLDPLSAVMMLVVTGVGFLIHVYSIGYMAHDESYARFFAYLNLFMFAMLMLVLGRQPAADVRRLGGRRALLVPADRLLVRRGRQRRRRQEGVHRQPHRRLRLPARHVPALRGASAPAAGGTLNFARSPRIQAHAASLALATVTVDRAAALRRRDRQVGADPALRLAARRDGRPDAGLGADPRGDDGHRRRLHDRAPERPVRRCRPTTLAVVATSAR